MRKTSHILGFLFLIAFSKSYSQDLAISDTCIWDINTFCGKYFTIFEDSSYYYDVGCEGHIAMQFGKLSQSEDGLVLHQSNFKDSSFLDTILYTCKTSQIDTVSVYFYSKEGYIYKSNVELSTLHLHNQWDSLSRRERDKAWSERGIERYHRRFFSEIYQLEYNSVSPDYDSLKIENASDEFLVYTQEDLVLKLRQFNQQTNVKLTFEVPRNTSEIHVYTKLPYKVVYKNQRYFDRKMKVMKSGACFECHGVSYCWE